MRLHLDAVSIAGGHAHVSARILDLDRRIGGNLQIDHLLVEIALRQAEEVEEVVVVVAPLGAHRSPEAVPT